MGSSDFTAEMAAIRKQLDPVLLASMHDAHDALGFECAAHGEGLACCMDWLFSDDGPELHQISRVAAYEMREG